MKIVFFVMFVPLYYAYINLAVKMSGISYLTKETVGKFMKAPSTYAFLFIMLMFIALCIIVEISGVGYACHRANYMKKTSPMRMMFVGVRTAVRSLRPRNLPICFFILCYLPFIGIVIFNFVLLNIRVPYLIDIVSINMYVTIAAVVLYGLILIYSLRYLFLFHIYNVERISFRRAIDRSKELLKGQRLRVTLGMLGWLLLMLGIPIAIFHYYSGPVLGHVLTSDSAVKVVTIVYEVIRIVFSAIYVIAGIPMVYSYICNTYYNTIPEVEGDPNIDNYDEYDAKKSSMKERKLLAVILALAIILDLAFYGLKRYNIISINVEYLDKVTITAHRGDSSGAPENTLAAFALAIENGADVIELDVRQTKDGEIVVMHDESLRRTCGVDKKVGELTYEELQQYSAGAKYRGPDTDLYEDEKVPTLREAIELVGDQALMNIELKPARTDTDLERKVAEIIEEYDYYDNCVVASLTYGAIRRAKQADNRIQTVYVMAVAMGDFYDLEYADGFSIKYRYITNEVVRNTHKRGKQIYAWTVDDASVLESMMLMDVDSIITNNPQQMRKSMYENYYGDTLIQRINEYIANQI